MGNPAIPKHGEDHCPDGPDPLPCLSRPVIRASNSSYQVTVPHLNDQELQFDQYENGDPSTFDVTLSTGRLRFVHLLRVGVYALTCRVTWESGSGDIGDPTLTEITLSDDYFNQDRQTFGNAFTANAPAYQFTLIRSYPVFRNADVAEAATPPYASILWRVNQSSPGSISQETEKFDMTSMEIVYLGPMFGITPTYP
jgi:hypothetical protein